jgi:hypothetical protein
MLLNRVSLSFFIHGVMTTRAERQGRNEALFREVNERIAELNQTFQVEGRSEFLCECSREACKEPVSISIDEYETVRRAATRFFVLPGHEDTSVESVVERSERYVVVEKIGEAAEEADALDPRS